MGYRLNPFTGTLDDTGVKTILGESGEAIFFLEDEAADVATYKVMDNPAQLLAESYVTQSTIADGQIIQSWITDVGLPNTTFIPSGLWQFKINAYKTGGTKEVRIYNEFYKRSAGGTETLLGTSANSIALTTVEVDLTAFSVFINGTTLLATDRIVTKTRMRLVGSGSNPTSVTLGYSGSTAARLSFPLQGDSDLVNTKTTAITFTIDGAGSAITTGTKAYWRCPYACTIQSVTMLADVSTTTSVDIWVDTYANYPPTDLDSITSSAVPTITTATKSEDTTLTGWDTAIAAGDCIAFNVDSNDNATKLTLILEVLKV